MWPQSDPHHPGSSEHPHVCVPVLEVSFWVKSREVNSHIIGHSVFIFNKRCVVAFLRSRTTFMLPSTRTCSRGTAHLLSRVQFFLVWRVKNGTCVCSHVHFPDTGKMNIFLFLPSPPALLPLCIGVHYGSWYQSLPSSCMIRLVTFTIASLPWPRRVLGLVW